MFDRTQREILRRLFISSDESLPTADPRIEILVGMVFDLLLEVEALRTGLLAANGSARAKDSPYGRAYRDTAYLTHNACGPSSGLEKLLALFYPSEAEEATGDWRERRAWRECLMLQRLGFSQEEVGAYKGEAKTAEMFT